MLMITEPFQDEQESSQILELVMNYMGNRHKSRFVKVGYF